MRHLSKPNIVGTAERSCRKALNRDSHLTALDLSTEGLLTVRCFSVLELGARGDQWEGTIQAILGREEVTWCMCPVVSWQEWMLHSSLWRQFSAEWVVDMEKPIYSKKDQKRFFQLAVRFMWHQSGFNEHSHYQNIYSFSNSLFSH